MPNDTQVIHLGPSEGDAFSAVGDVYRVPASGRQQETYTHFQRFAYHQTTGRLRTFILVKTNVFLFWKARSTFRSVMKRSQPGLARSFKGLEGLHTVLRTTRNCRLACWGLLPRQDLRISSKNLRDQSRHSIRRRYRLAKTNSINYWRPRRNTAFRFCRRTNEGRTMFRETLSAEMEKQRDSAALFSGSRHG